jgi:ketosteroid isomerase-like protein
MRMEWLIVAALSVTVAASSIQESRAEFVRLEESWNAAHRNGDAQALDRLWADDLEVDVPRMPSMSKTEVLAFARTGRMRFERYETSEIRVRTYGETAVVTGRLLRTRTVDGKQLSDDWRFTKVYARQAGAWRVVSFHASDSPPPK